MGYAAGPPDCDPIDIHGVSRPRTTMARVE